MVVCYVQKLEQNLASDVVFTGQVSNDNHPEDKEGLLAKFFVHRHQDSNDSKDSNLIKMTQNDLK